MGRIPRIVVAVLVAAACLSPAACSSKPDAKSTATNDSSTNPVIELPDSGSAQGSDSQPSDTSPELVPNGDGTDATTPDGGGSDTAGGGWAVDPAVCPALDSLVALGQAVPNTVDDPGSTSTLVDDTLQQFETANPPVEYVNDWATMLRLLTIAQADLQQVDQGNPQSTESVAGSQDVIYTFGTQAAKDAAYQLGLLQSQHCQGATS